MVNNKNLENLMKSVDVPNVRHDFANDIIMKSRRIHQKRSLWNMFKIWCEDCHIPSPQYSFASLLIMGFMIGFSVDTIGNDDDLYTQLFNDGGFFDE